MRKKLLAHVSFCSTCFCYYLKHPNNENMICPLSSSNNTFMTDTQYFGTIQIWIFLNEHHYYLTSTKFVICQIGTNCSLFQLLNMLSFHVGLELLKLICYSLILFFSKYHIKTGTLCLLF